MDNWQFSNKMDNLSKLYCKLHSLLSEATRLTNEKLNVRYQKEICLSKRKEKEQEWNREIKVSDEMESNRTCHGV